MSIQDLNNPEINKKLNELKIIIKQNTLKYLDKTKISVDTLNIVIKFVIESIEKTSLKGTKQKELAIEIIRSLVNDLIEDRSELTTEKKLLLAIIDSGSLGNTIDLIIDASNGNININKLKKTSILCCLNMIPYLLKKLKN